MERKRIGPFQAPETCFPPMKTERMKEGAREGGEERKKERQKKREKLQESNGEREGPGMGLCQSY